MKVAVLGGGAAGMMAAATAQVADPSAEIFLIEKNTKLGAKVLISGGGRCNVTTGFSDLRLILDRYPRGGKFLASSFHVFPPEAVYEWFEAQGVPLKIEADLRVFPCSNDGKDVVAAFERIFKQHQTQILMGHTVSQVKKTKQGFEIHFKDQEPILVDRVILTTGGQAQRQTGSTGDGYAFSEALGHHITALAPSLNSFIVKETWLRNLAGVSLPKVHLMVKLKKKFEFTGPMLFTHRGLSGPAVFALSSLIAFEVYTTARALVLHVDFLPFMNQAIFESELKKNLSANPKKMFKNVLADYLPKSLAEALCEQLMIQGEKNSYELSKKELQKMTETLKNLELNLIGRGAGDEFVTAGGVELSEINPRTMESKLCPGLYFAGEILDIDGFTGGYNLQAAWATGRVAGLHAIEKT